MPVGEELIAVARSTLLFPAFRNASSRGAALAVPLLACLALQGCFSPVEEPEYNVKKGEMISGFDMEVEPDGSILLLAQIGMYYSREGAPSDYELSNLHTVLFRRAKGAWSATPFKNLQSEQDFFPSFILDRDGGYRVLVLDVGRAKSYGLQGNRWTPQATLRRARSFAGNSWRSDRNWNRSLQIGYKDDTTLYQVFWEDDGTAKLRESRGLQEVHTLGFGFVPLAFHAGNGYSALIGMERTTSDSGTVSHLALQLWREDPKNMSYFLLDGLISPYDTLDLPRNGFDNRNEWLIWPSEVFFAPYRNGTGLYYCREVDCRILSLDSSGLPAGIDVPDADPKSLKVDPSSKIAPDTDGCLHGVEQFFERDSKDAIIPQGGNVRAAGSVVVWDACRRKKDTVAIWESPTGKNFSLVSRRFRILPDGSPVIAALVQEEELFPSQTRAEAPLGRTWLILAERKQGVWSTEVVYSR